MHDEIVCGNVKEFQNNRYTVNNGVASKKRFVVEPDNVVIVYMMAKMFVANIFIGAIARTDHPGEKTTQSSIVIILSENGIVSAIV